MTLRGFDLTGAALLLGVGVVTLVGWQLWRHRGELGALVNPANDKNVVYQGVNSIVEGVSGGASQGGESTIGGAIARLAEKIGVIPDPMADESWRQAGRRDPAREFNARLVDAGGYYP